jgi:hypothetical protein
MEHEFQESARSAVGAALERIDECETVNQLLETAGHLASLFQHNAEVLEFLHEQSVFALERIRGRRPEMTLEIFRKIMRGTVADA